MLFFEERDYFVVDRRGLEIKLFVVFLLLGIFVVFMLTFYKIILKTLMC